MIIDAHVHIANKKTEKIPQVDIDSTIRYMDEAGVDKAIGFLYDPVTFEENIKFIDVIGPYKERIIPYAWLNPLEEDVGKKLVYCLDELGMKGLKIHPLLHHFDLGDLEKMDELMMTADKRRLHVIVHCTSNETLVDTQKVEQLARRYHNCIIQLAHTGAIYDGNKAIEVACRNENVYLDTGCASMNCIRRAILRVPEKVLMGCDWPSYTFKMEMMKIKDACELAGNKEAYEMVCGQNILKIIDREER